MHSHWDRRVIPRWRSSKVSSTLLESAPTKLEQRQRDQDDSGLLAQVDNQVKAWSQAPTLGVAADLLNFSHIDKLRPLLVEPSKFITSHGSDVSIQLQGLANSILETGSLADSDMRAVDYNNEIARLKSQLRINPRDSIALIDIARLYAALGQHDHARKAVITASALQPNHRFIIRSATRFFLHDGNPDQAFHILNRSARTPEDPWLLASLIAVETVLGRSPKHIKRARAMTDGGNFAASHLSELGAALATVYVNAGEIKNAKRLFNASLSSPNDNAVAQAVWAANEFKMPINIRSEWLIDKFSSEAYYYTVEKAGDFNAALQAAKAWFEDEPFSSRPLIAGAFSSSILGIYSEAEANMKQALRLEPTNLECKNNLVFALAGQNKLAEAAQILNEVWQAELHQEGSLGGHTLANIGMVFYREGDYENGRLFYDKAYSVLDKGKQPVSKMLAAAYWVQEAKLAKDPQLDSVLSRFQDLVEGSSSLAAKHVLATALGTAIPDGAAQAKEIFRSAVSWEHDPKKNLLIISKKPGFGNRRT